MALKIKICGITNLDDARVATELGADALGFNFYDKSPRYISPDDASEIIAKLPSKIAKAGVFVNAELELIRSLDSILDFFQLHGDESPDYASALGNEKVIKALRVGAAFDPRRALDYSAGNFLLDAETTDFGGSGKSFDWEAAIRFKQLVPRFYLAGGLDPDNIADAITRVGPYGIDVCSGVESVKGKKDHKRLEAFVQNARKAV